MTTPDRPASAVRFPRDDAFHRDLKARVDGYFRESGLRPRDVPAMYLKTAVIFAWLVGSYAALVFFAHTAWLQLLCAASLGLAMAGVGMAVQHDANHGAYSSRRSVNRVMGFSLDLIGASSFVWGVKHNVVHHTYTNVAGVDQDLVAGGFVRLAPSQAWRPMHRFQRFYTWPLYGFLTLKWHLWDDVGDLVAAHIGPQRFARPRGAALASFVAGKAVFFGLGIALPLFFHPVAGVVAFFVLVNFVLSVTLAVVFQLAHCVQEAEFPDPPAAGEQMPTAWAAHQVSTTVDFAPRNRVLCWYLGGLNFQVVHHLFPRVSHLHYPALAPIVAATCADHGLRYRTHATARAALASHYRWLARMGRAASTTAAASEGLGASLPALAPGA